MTYEPIDINPKKCSHRMLTSGIDDNYIPFIYCVSCDIEISKAWREGRDYEYDIDNNVWIDINN